LTAFFVRRLLLAIALVVVSSSAALLLTRLAPGDLTTQLGVTASAGEIAATRERFDLDRSPLAQWGRWAARAIRLDFGESFLYNRPVGPLVRASALNTAALAVVALVTATVLGIGCGVVTGSRRGGLLPSIVRTLSLTAISIPPLLASLLLAFVAARTGWLPVGGMGSVGATDRSWLDWSIDLAWHLPLPVLALALPLAATFERLQAQSMVDALHQPFVTAARARGALPRDVVRRHAWPVSLPSICGVYGIAIGALFSGSFVVEYITAWPGLGRLMYEALRARDIYLVAGCAAMGSVFLAIGTLAGDLLLAVVDPRVREAAAP
jgi:peptide/nickel transport system permease protein